MARIVRHDARFPRHVRLNDGEDGAGLHVVYDDAARLAASAIYQGEHLVLVVEAASALLAPGLDGLVVPDEGLVHFNHAAVSAEWRETTFPHRFPDSVRHKPRRLERNPERAVKLVGADAFLAARNKEDGLQPDVEGDVARFKDRSPLTVKGFRQSRHL